MTLCKHLWLRQSRFLFPFFQADIKLQYCEVPPSGTCCTSQTEHELALKSQLKIEEYTENALKNLSLTFGTRVEQFNRKYSSYLSRGHISTLSFIPVMFKQLMSSTRNEFHTQLKQQFGPGYEMNSHIFEKFFRNLEGYYAHGNLGMTEIMDSLFKSLFQTLFAELNQNHSFDDE